MEEEEEERRGNVIRGGNERDKEKVEGRVCERERERESGSNSHFAPRFSRSST